MATTQRRCLAVVVTLALVVTILSPLTADAMPFNFDTEETYYDALNEERDVATGVASHRIINPKMPSATKEKEQTDVSPYHDESESLEYLKLILMRWLRQSHDLGLIDFKTYLYDVLSLEQLDLKSLRKELDGWAAERNKENKVLGKSPGAKAIGSKNKVKSITKGGLGDELDSEADNGEGSHKSNVVSQPKTNQRKTKPNTSEKKHAKPTGNKTKHLAEAEQLLASLSKLNTNASVRSNEHDERSLDEEDENDLMPSSDWSRKREEKSEQELKREAMLEWLDLSREEEE